jgi:ABC-type polysaccharide/polyol phosphate export permease
MSIVARAPHRPKPARDPLNPRTSPWFGHVAELIRFFPVVRNLVTQELTVRYHRSALGFLWTLINPLLMMATLATVFSTVFKLPPGGYVVHLFSGMIPWAFLQTTVSESTTCWIQNDALLRKVYLPKLVFPFSRVLINLTTMLLTMVAFFLLLIPLGARPSWALLGLPVAVVLWAAFALGLGLLAGVLNTFYRDVGHIIGVGMQAWYYATPILYRPDQLPDPIQHLLWLNPAYGLMRLFQDTIRDGVWPAWDIWLAATVTATVCLGVGYAAFRAAEPKLIFRL